MSWRKSKGHVCKICGRDFDKKRQLKSHLRDKCKPVQENENGGKETRKSLEKV